ncbi:MAG: bifunctional demethylmenaquinone methyltransferase/2-methoxy-6-polyprenyl-1,4-benzoquinol methylase UbiE [Desulfobacteraceae bacterium]|nr:bifunctional demethylmenaquinone methyltransferase/2-methoxy-6-polyprenyl-1,4-benzoquinol methylase UbiE [Desulfobacteraceae bacterium]
MTQKELPFIRAMFDSIAPRYDLLNRLLSMRRDVMWRRKLVTAMGRRRAPFILDVACGTGDVIVEALWQTHGGAVVVGVDFAPRMLKLAQAKLELSPFEDKVSLAAADALALPFHDGLFDAVTIAFGIRNIQNRLDALKAFHKALKPGGVILILELTLPRSGPLHRLYLLYFQKLLPLIGRCFSRHASAYTYLPASVLNFPDHHTFMTTMRTAGFQNVTCSKLTLGIATLFRAIKPENA